MNCLSVSSPPQYIGMYETLPYRACTFFGSTPVFPDAGPGTTQTRIRKPEPCWPGPGPVRLSCRSVPGSGLGLGGFCRHRDGRQLQPGQSRHHKYPIGTGISTDRKGGHQGQRLHTGAAGPSGRPFRCVDLYWNRCGQPEAHRPFHPPMPISSPSSAPALAWYSRKALDTLSPLAYG